LALIDSVLYQSDHLLLSQRLLFGALLFLYQKLYLGFSASLRNSGGLFLLPDSPHFGFLLFSRSLSSFLFKSPA
jgi:hypothetical protein